MEAPDRVDGAEVSGPVGGGRVIEPMSPVAVDLDAHGYVEEEFFVSGVAASYRAMGELGGDGRWSVEPESTSPYRTRMVVRRPAATEDANGTVVVEWLNVSGGVEAAADWSYLGDEMVRQGYTYVAVSVQSLGIDGGVGLVDAGAGVSGLRGRDPARYATLHHPGDRFAFDIYAQTAEALRGDAGGPVLGGARPARVVAIGESQSAMFLTAYIDALAPVHGAFDGYFVHSRGGGAASLAGVALGAPGLDGVRIRDDLDTPVFVFETETDLGPRLDYGRGRQPDTDRFRAWEVAGTAHADAFLVGPFAAHLGCTGLVNDGPHHVVAMAAFRAFHRWVVAGTEPPRAAPLEMRSAAPPVVARDSFGNALGGVRTPAVDTPVSTLSGEPRDDASALCSLFGQTVPFDRATLTRLYGDEAGYREAHGRALEEAVGAGFVLADDAPSLADAARQFRFPGA